MAGWGWSRVGSFPPTLHLGLLLLRAPRIPTVPAGTTPERELGRGSVWGRLQPWDSSLRRGCPAWKARGRVPWHHPWPEGSRANPVAPAACLPACLLDVALLWVSPVLGQWPALGVGPWSWAGAHSTSPSTQEMPAQGTGTLRAARPWRPRQPTLAASASTCPPLLCWPSRPRTW